MPDTLSKKSAVTVGLALGVGALIFVPTLRVLSAVHDLETSHKLSTQGLSTAVRANTEAIKEFTNELTSRVTMNDLRVFAQLLQAKNPDLSVPDLGR